jgi:hypothetical protein
MQRADFIGLEFDWFAVDSDGFLALFASAGWGPVPDAVFGCYENQRLIEARMYSLCGGAAHAPIQFNFEDLIPKGVFAYDWHQTYGPYRRVDLPLAPRTASDLGLSQSLKAALIPLSNLKFSNSPELKRKDIPSFTEVENRQPL